MNGDAGPVRDQFNLAREAWAAEGKAAPYLATGFWCCLAEDADARLKKYVFDYLRIAGDEIGKIISDTMYTSNEDAVRRVLDAIEAEGCDECFLVPATHELVEIDRLAEIAVKR